MSVEQKPTLEIHTIDGVHYLYCQKMQKYYYFKYNHLSGAKAAMKMLLSSWPIDFATDMDYCFLHNSSDSGIMFSDYKG